MFQILHHKIKLFGSFDLYRSHSLLIQTIIKNYNSHKALQSEPSNQSAAHCHLTDFWEL